MPDGSSLARDIEHFHSPTISIHRSIVGAAALHFLFNSQALAFNPVAVERLLSFRIVESHTH